MSFLKFFGILYYVIYFLVLCTFLNFKVWGEVSVVGIKCGCFILVIVGEIGSRVSGFNFDLFVLVGRF